MLLLAIGAERGCAVAAGRMKRRILCSWAPSDISRLYDLD